MVEAPILEDQMKQPKPKKELQEVIARGNWMGWYLLMDKKMNHESLIQCL
jgi:hypothetical protein